MKSSGIIYYYDWNHPQAQKASARIPDTGHRIPTSGHRPPATGHHTSLGATLGLGLIALALGGLLGPLTPFLRMEAGYRYMQAKAAVIASVPRIESEASFLLASVSTTTKGVSPAVASLITNISNHIKPKPKNIAATAKTVLFTPLTTPDGASIDPVDTNFGLIIPKIGVNAKVIPAVDPTNPGDYEKALQEGVAHASTSYFPNEDGTVYLFSHSTSYDWFVKDLNAVFYLVKNLDTGDVIVILYKGKEYTYKITEKKVVSPEAVSYLVPHAGIRSLILQTCWPPGSTSERLLIFADYIEGSTSSI